MKTTLTSVALLIGTLLGKTQNNSGDITVNAVQQKNPFASPEERNIFSAKTPGLWPSFTPEEKRLIINFLNYSLSGPSTSDTRAWASDPVWSTGTMSQMQMLLVERARLAQPTFWSGNMSYSVSGPASFTGDIVPATFRNQPSGNYRISYLSGGPPDSSFAGADGALYLQNGVPITFILHFQIFPEWRRVIEMQPSRPIYGDCPVKEPGKENLVVVTHGWRPDMTWVEAMTNIIIKYVAGQNLNNWQVHAHKWLEKASQGGPKTALNNGKEEGVNLGKQIAGQGFGHVHLIAHSAGAGLIQSASETIKSLRSDIVVHLTFLDAFVGFNYEERGNYGKGADWSDSYFSRDFETSSRIYPFTEGVLDYAYNVDVTWLDTHLEEIQVSSSTSSGEVSQTCYQKVTSHSWPYQFYTNTVPPNTMIGSEGFGFPLSKEGGNWNFATNQYKVGKNALRVLGSSELSCVPNPSANSFHIELSLDFSKLPGASVIINSPGNVIIHGIDFTLKTASPAWMVAFIPITNKVNFVSLEAEFTSANGAEGLLSVYWETNVIGSVDERVVLPEVRQYTFPLPETATNSTRTLGFRLDAFSAIQSSVMVTNVALGFSGVREPFLLSFTGASKNGLPVLQLTGPAGFNYRVEFSTNLADWSTMAILVNTNGIVRFVDPSTNNAPARFYRAVAP